MINILWQLDRGIFLFINHLPHNLIPDSFFAFLSGAGNWGIIWFVILTILFIIEELKDRKIIVVFILAGILTFLVTDGGLKHLVRRPRPEFSLSSVIVVYDHARSFSFPSGHTTIAFAAAYIMAREHKKWQKFYYLLAVLIAFSRIYLGKHYPGDVLAGIIIGSLIGYLSLFTVNKYLSRVNNPKINVK